MVGIGQGCAAHVGSSEGKKDNVCEFSSSMGRGSCIDQLLQTKAIEQCGQTEFKDNKNEEKGTRT
jgi:hypothetical protein